MLLEWLDSPLVVAPEVTLLRFSRRAMATTFEIALPFNTPHAYEAAYDGLDLIDELESQLTIYRANSEVSQLNELARTEAVPVEQNLFELLQLCADLQRESGGAFDIGIGALSRAWGFTNRNPAVPDPDSLALARANSGFRHVILEAKSRSVKYARSRLELNLGSIGKGYALDRVATRLRQRWGITSALLQGGGSSILALGTPPGQPRGWGIAIRHPRNDGSHLATAWVIDQGLGTSAATFQRFHYNGQYLGHILDPRSGWPAQGIASSTAVAPSASLADAWSTAWFILGVSAAQEKTRTSPDLAALLLPDHPNATPILFGNATTWTTPLNPPLK